MFEESADADDFPLLCIPSGKEYTLYLVTLDIHSIDRLCPSQQKHACVSNTNTTTIMLPAPPHPAPNTHITL